MSNYIELQTISAARDGMNGASKRHSAITDNMANINTPGFKRREVHFESQLKEAYLGNKTFEDQFKDRNFFDEDFDPFDKPDFAYESPPVRPTVHRVDDTSMRNDKNNVDPDRQMAKMAKNSLYYKGMSSMTKTQFSLLNGVINKLQGR
ncbi:MAG: flagellar basal body rod protein FlgB [bacterium]